MDRRNADASRGTRGVGVGSEVVPLTDFQAQLGRWLAAQRSEDSHLAGGAAILAAPETLRYSHDLDYFHDSAERVATAFSATKRPYASVDVSFRSRSANLATFAPWSSAKASGRRLSGRTIPRGGSCPWSPVMTSASNSIRSTSRPTRCSRSRDAMSPATSSTPCTFTSGRSHSVPWSGRRWGRIPASHLDHSSSC